MTQVSYEEDVVSKKEIESLNAFYATFKGLRGGDINNI